MGGGTCLDSIKPEPRLAICSAAQAAGKQRGLVFIDVVTTYISSCGRIRWYNGAARFDARHDPGADVSSRRYVTSNRGHLVGCGVGRPSCAPPIGPTGKSGRSARRSWSRGWPDNQGRLNVSRVRKRLLAWFLVGRLSTQDEQNRVRAELEPPMPKEFKIRIHPWVGRNVAAHPPASTWHESPVHAHSPHNTRLTPGAY
eukprot:363239-Chlamydomonas_euryale.AAC.8